MTTASNRWLIIIGVSLGALVVLALAIAAFANSGNAPEYPADTPEGIVQRYLAAVQDEDLAAAYAYLSPEVKEYCSLEDWRRQGPYPADQIDQSQITLKSVRRPTEDEAVVTVTVTSYGQPDLIPVPPAENSYDQQFFLDRLTDGSWVFSEAPWPLFGCYRAKPPETPTPTPTPTSSPTPTATPLAGT